jgi:mRNA capping enzyme, catalytic domain
MPEIHLKHMLSRYILTKTELEIRIIYNFKTDIISLKKILNFQQSSLDTKNISVERTINCIKSRDKYTNYIYEVSIPQSRSKKDTCVKNTYTKTRKSFPIFDQVNGIKYKISLAEELNIKDYKAEECDLIRFKNRISIKNPITFSNNKTILHNWRMDITLVKTLRYVREFNLDDLDSYISQLFPNDLTEQNFVEDAPYEYADSVEVELEYIGDTKPTESDVITAVESIALLPISTTVDINNILSRIAKWIQPNSINKYISGKAGTKQLLPQVVSLNINSLYDVLLPNIKEYYVSPKLDGIRAIVFMDNKNKKYYAVSNVLSSLTLLDFGCSSDQTDIQEGETILDTELYEDRFYIFDIIAYRGKPVFKEIYRDREKYIDKLLDDFKGCYNLIKKQSFDLAHTNLKNVLDIKWEFDTDGLVFTPSNLNYISSVVFKWKPSTHLSIDFLIRENSLNVGINRKVANKLYSFEKLRNTFSKDTYGPMIFDPTYQPLKQIKNINVINHISDIDNKSWPGLTNKVVAECVWNNKWDIIKIREDRQILVDKGRYFGNNARVADLIWQSIFWPIEPKDLLGKKMHNHRREDIYVNNNRDYFKKLYTYMLNEHKVSNLLDIGIYYIHINNMTTSGINKMDFVVSDGFSCLNIINQKYDDIFIDSPPKHIIIKTYKTEDYIHDIKDNTVCICILPTQEQIKIIKEKSILDSMKKNIHIKIVVPNKKKFLLGKHFSNSKLTQYFPPEKNMESLSKLYLLSYSQM